MNNSFKEFINDYSNINKEVTVTHEYKYGVLYHNDKGFYFYDNNKFSIIDRKFTGMAKKTIILRYPYLTSTYLNFQTLQSLV